MILVDTSVWIDHLRRGDPALASALGGGEVLTHPFIVGEIACGHLDNRSEVLRLLQRLPSAPVADTDEVLAMVEARGLMGKGIGYVDCHLLAAILLEGSATLWTRDGRLASVASELGVLDQQHT